MRCMGRRNLATGKKTANLEVSCEDHVGDFLRLARRNPQRREINFATLFHTSRKLIASYCSGNHLRERTAKCLCVNGPFACSRCRVLQTHYHLGRSNSLQLRHGPYSNPWLTPVYPLYPVCQAEKF